MERTYDLIVVGSGVAGLYGALCAAAEADVLLVSKGPVLTSSSWLAQGGVAAAAAGDDEPELHYEDTLAAGRGLCRASAARVLTEEAPAHRGERGRARAGAARARRPRGGAADGSAHDCGARRPAGDRRLRGAVGT